MWMVEKMYKQGLSRDQDLQGTVVAKTVLGGYNILQN